MDWLSVIGALSGLGALYVALRKLSPEISVTKAQEKSSLAAAVDTAAGTLIDALKFAQEERKEFETRIDALEKKNDDQETTNKDLEKKLADQEKQIEQLNRDYAAEIQKVNEKYNKSKRVIEKLVRALEDAKIPVPDFNGDLSDSIRRYRLPK